MKKHFFRMVMALSLACGAFAFTGCTDYEDDINALNNRIDQLETGKIADVAEQVSALEDALSIANQTISTLESSLNTLTGTTIPGLEDRLEAVEALEDDLDALRQTVDGIKASLGDYATKDYVDATFATLQSVQDLNEDLGALSGRVDKLETSIADLDDKFTQSLENAKTELQNAINAASKSLSDEIESLRASLQNYATKEELRVKADSLDNALKEEIAKKLDATEFTQSLGDALAEALENGGTVDSYISQKISDAQTVFAADLKNVQDLLDALVGKVEDLANRIQSLVFVPEYNDGKATVISYTLFGEQVGDNIVTATFQVTPASLAANLVNQPENVVANVIPLQTRSASGPSFVASKADGTLDLSLRENVSGYVDVEIILPANEFSEAGTYAFALYVASAEDVESVTEDPDALADIDAGTYVSSEYVQTAPESSEKFNGEISQLYSLRNDETKEEISDEVLNQRIEWARLTRGESTAVDFYDGYSVYLQLGDEYYTLEDAAAEIRADVEDITPKYLAAAPEYTVPEGVTPALELAEYFSVADAGHLFHEGSSVYGKTVEMAQDAVTMSSVAGAAVSIANSFYFGDTPTFLNTVISNTTTYTVVNEPVVINIEVPAVTEWSYAWALAHANKGIGGELYPNTLPIEFTDLQYTVEEGSLGSTDIGTILARVYQSEVTLNGEVLDNVSHLLMFDYSSQTNTIDVGVIGYRFAADVENVYKYTYIYEDELVNYEVNFEFTLGVMPGDITVSYGEGGIPVFTTSGHTENLADGYELAFAGLGENASEWFAEGEFETSFDNAVETVNVTRTANGEQTETVINDPAWTYLRIDPYTNAPAATGSHLRISSTVVTSVGDIFDFTTSYKTWYGVTYTFTAKRTITGPSYYLDFNPAFVTDGNVTLKYHEEEGAYVLDSADPRNYFVVAGIPADFSESLTVKFNVTTPDTEAGNPPVIPVLNVDNATGRLESSPIEWGDFRGRDLVVEAVLMLGTNLIEVGTATVNISADALVDTFDGADNAEVERSANEETVIRLWQYLTATGLDGSDNFINTANETLPGANDEMMKLYGAVISFGELKAYIGGAEYDGEGHAYTYDATAGTITVNNDNATLNDIKFVVEVSLSYYLDNNVPETTDITVTITER